MENVDVKSDFLNAGLMEVFSEYVRHRAASAGGILYGVTQKAFFPYWGKCFEAGLPFPPFLPPSLLPSCSYLLFTYHVVGMVNIIDSHSKGSFCNLIS